MILINTPLEEADEEVDGDSQEIAIVIDSKDEDWRWS